MPSINWLLFAAMNEAFLLSIGEEYDPMRMNGAIRKINEWYVGDGWIKDGQDFHFDYYCSYVMWPMLLEALDVLVARRGQFWNGKPEELLAQATRRAQRYCEHLERFVGPEGTYPPIGRSITYRTAVFQPLALLALRKQLPKSLPEGQVRAALHAAHRAIWDAPGNFTKDGYLTIGFRGHQPTRAILIRTTAACTSLRPGCWRWACRRTMRSGPHPLRTGRRRRHSTVWHSRRTMR